MEDNWKHRSSKMKCGTCMYFVEKHSVSIQSSDNVIGRCRANAPTMKGWPVLFSKDWCGNHKLDENKLESRLTSNPTHKSSRTDYNVQAS